MAEVLPAMLMFKLILQNQTVSEIVAVIRIVDEIVMPLLRPLDPRA